MRKIADLNPPTPCFWLWTPPLVLVYFWHNGQDRGRKGGAEKPAQPGALSREVSLRTRHPCQHRPWCRRHISGRKGRLMQSKRQHSMRINLQCPAPSVYSRASPYHGGGGYYLRVSFRSTQSRGVKIWYSSLERQEIFGTRSLAVISGWALDGHYYFRMGSGWSLLFPDGLRMVTVISGWALDVGCYFRCTHFGMRHP